MELDNFNSYTDHLKFPAFKPLNTLADCERRPYLWAWTNYKPHAGDPGFIVETINGRLYWIHDLQHAHMLAECVETACAIYAADECGEYFKQFAVAA